MPLAQHPRAALAFIDAGVQSRDSVLVHCNLGESRSPSIGLLYLATRMTAIYSLNKNLQWQSSKIALDVIANPAADGLIEGRRIQQQ
jgi:predicted protein tyrosine phosphatase